MKNRKYLGMMLLLVLVACSQSDTGFDVIQTDSAESIVGGNKAASSEPVTSSTVSILLDNSMMGWKSNCTGTLISRDLIMTATHCLEGYSAGSLLIYFGDTLPKRIEKNLEGFYEVASFLTHPNYTVILDRDGSKIVSGINDIAVIRLKGKVPSSAVPVPVLDERVSLQAGQSFILAGYGLLNEIDHPVRADGLYSVKVPLTEVLDVNLVTENSEILSSILVTDQRSGKGACLGDSGGPAYLETSDGLIVAGITRGAHDGVSDCRHYGEYTLASKYKDFLLESAAKLGAEAPRFVITE